MLNLYLFYSLSRYSFVYQLAATVWGLCSEVQLGTFIVRPNQCRPMYREPQLGRQCGVPEKGGRPQRGPPRVVRQSCPVLTDRDTHRQSSSGRLRGLLPLCRKHQRWPPQRQCIQWVMFIMFSMYVVFLLYLLLLLILLLLGVRPWLRICIRRLSLDLLRQRYIPCHSHAMNMYVFQSREPSYFDCSTVYCKIAYLLHIFRANTFACHDFHSLDWLKIHLEYTLAYDLR